MSDRFRQMLQHCHGAFRLALYQPQVQFAFAWLFVLAVVIGMG